MMIGSVKTGTITLIVGLSIVLVGCSRFNEVAIKDEEPISVCAPAPVSENLIKCLRKKFEAGDSRAAFVLWSHLATGGNYERAFPWLYLAAALAYPRAQLSVSAHQMDLAIANGDLGDESKYRKSIDELIKLSDGGLREAAGILAIIYHTSNPVKASYWENREKTMKSRDDEDERLEKEMLESCRHHE